MGGPDRAGNAASEAHRLGQAQPLQGVRVFDFTRLLPGAYATLVLADLGAEVVKVEDPRGGDPVRAMPPRRNGVGVYFDLLNRNKRSMTLDLRAPDAPTVLSRVIEHADVVVESFRPETARRFGVDGAALRSRFPRLVHASISGFGQTGPYAGRAAHDINYQALAGLLSASVPGDAGPHMPRLLVADIGGAMNAVAAILAALFHRERTGAGAAVDISLHEAALAWLMVAVPPGELPLDRLHACYNIYETADRRHVALGALEPKFWAAFCQRIGRPDLVPLQYADGREQARVLEEVRAVMRTRTRDEWIASFDGADACLSAVQTREEALNDRHARARGAVTTLGAATYVVGTDGIAVRPAPALGEHTDEVLAAAGFDAGARTRLRTAGAI